MAYIASRIDGEFTGFDDGATFALANGQVWQQARYRYHYHYAYCPEVVINRNGGSFIMEVPCMNDSIEVMQATILTEGTIVSDFKGFKADAEFTFSNGHVWKQTEHKYQYHYSHRPKALVIDGVNGRVLTVNGMQGAVRVSKVR